MYEEHGQRTLSTLTLRRKFSGNHPGFPLEDYMRWMAVGGLWSGLQWMVGGRLFSPQLFQQVKWESIIDHHHDWLI